MSSMRVVGYTDQLSVAQGGRVSVYVSCQDPEYDVAVVRLRHGDRDSRGPGFRSTRVPSPVDGVKAGLNQPITSGSWLDSSPFEVESESMSLAVWTWPTTPILGRVQHLLGLWRSDGSGYGLCIKPGGQPALVEVGVDDQLRELVSADFVLEDRTWYLLVATLNGSEGSVGLQIWTRHPHSKTVYSESLGALVMESAERFRLVGAARISPEGDPQGLFNGKLGRPTAYPFAISDSDVELFLIDETPTSPAAVAWDLSLQLDTDVVVDVSGSENHGSLVNLPERAVKGWNWTGRRTDPALAPTEYGAVWFHEDDLEDAGWAPGFELTVPDDWGSGIYAFELTGRGVDRFVDHVPFVVRPREGAPRNPILFLAPTFSWLAYAQDHAHVRPDRLVAMGITLDDLVSTGTPYEQKAFRYILDNRLCGLYDEHTDGSGVHYSSRLRPIVTMRPGFNKASSRFRLAHQLNADLYLIDWLDELGFPYDVATDDDLHANGPDLLAHYSVLMTGTHPEYWSSAMLDALEQWTDDGGRLMYMGGNGFYWATSVDSRRPHVIEVRRQNFPGATGAPLPGEGVHSTTGEPGGTWRSRGRPPEQIVGVGSRAIGLHTAVPFVRTKASDDDRVAFAFDGVKERTLGEAGLHLGAAAGWEVDCSDPAAGTPPHAVVLAEAMLPPHDYAAFMDTATSSSLATADPDALRAEVVFFETNGGGAVFSVGSIAYAACLSEDRYANALSRLTANVLERFMDPQPFVLPEYANR